MGNNESKEAGVVIDGDVNFNSSHKMGNKTSSDGKIIPDAVVDGDVINAMCSDDPEVKCTIIKPTDVVEIRVKAIECKGNHLENICKIIHTTRNLRILSLSKALTGFDMVDNVLNAILDRKLPIQDINLSWSRGIDLDAAKKLRRILETPGVRFLGLESCELNSEMLTQIFEGHRPNASKQKLDVKGNAISDKLLLHNQDVLFSGNVDWTRWDGKSSENEGECMQLNNAPPAYQN